MLSAEGMSTTAIAPIVGASREQVRRDISGDTNVSPDSAGALKATSGMDVKTYQRPAIRNEPKPDALCIE